MRERFNGRHSGRKHSTLLFSFFFSHLTLPSRLTCFPLALTILPFLFTLPYLSPFILLTFLPTFLSVVPFPSLDTLFPSSLPYFSLSFTFFPLSYPYSLPYPSLSVFLFSFSVCLPSHSPYLTLLYPLSLLSFPFFPYSLPYLSLSFTFSLSLYPPPLPPYLTLLHPISFSLFPSSLPSSLSLAHSLFLFLLKLPSSFFSPSPLSPSSHNHSIAMTTHRAVAARRPRHTHASHTPKKE